MSANVGEIEAAVARGACGGETILATERAAVGEAEACIVSATTFISDSTCITELLAWGNTSACAGDTLLTSVAGHAVTFVAAGADDGDTE